MEQTLTRRHCADISVVCRHLTANSPVLKGKMLDCSCKGTCIELDQKIQEGSIVMIAATVRGREEDLPTLPEGFRSFTLAEVQWAKPIEDDGLHIYAIGLRYLSN